MNLIINKTAVRVDNDARYCLNDVWEASGKKDNQRPSQWLRTQTAKNLIVEIKAKNDSHHSANMHYGNQDFEPVKIVKGDTVATYAVKSLVYAYAMWISPAFNLYVIDTFDYVMTAGPKQQLAFEAERNPFYPDLIKELEAGRSYSEAGAAVGITPQSAGYHAGRIFLKGMAMRGEYYDKRYQNAAVATKYKLKHNVPINIDVRQMGFNFGGQA